MRLGSGILCAVLAWVATGAQADQWTKIPDEEIRLLPGYCQVRMQKLNSPEYKSLEAAMGPDLLHTHHFCAALVYLKRYYGERNTARRSDHLGKARSNLQYMLDHASPGYVLMPEIYLNMGEVERIAGNPGKARSAYEKSIELAKNSPRAFGALADLLRDGGHRDQALAVVSEGLRHNPEATTLQRRYRDLGGALPYPAPAEAAKPAPPAQAAGVAAAEKPAEASASATPAAAATPAPPATAPEPAKPRIGSPTNPYCRFCVD